MFIIVHLPEPLGPTMATNSPRGSCRSTSRSACTVDARSRSPCRRRELDEAPGVAAPSMPPAPRIRRAPSSCWSSISSTTILVPSASVVAVSSVLMPSVMPTSNLALSAFSSPGLSLVEHVDAPRPLRERRLGRCGGWACRSCPSAGVGGSAARRWGRAATPFDLGGADGHGRRHPRAQLLVGVVDVDDGRVGRRRPETVLGLKRTCCTTPLNDSPGNASTTHLGVHASRELARRRPRRRRRARASCAGPGR